MMTWTLTTFRTHNMETEDCRLERHCLLTLRSGLEKPPPPIFLPFAMGDLCPAGYPRPAVASSGLLGRLSLNALTQGGGEAPS